MKDQFVTYEIALRLKELGFSQTCFAFYNSTREAGPVQLYSPDGGDFNNWNEKPHLISIPLWQQAIDWLRENYKINVGHDLMSLDPTYLVVTDEKTRFIHGKTDEQAREASILKALELIKPTTPVS